MKGAIEVEVENEEDLSQLENELQAGIDHTTHLEGEVEVLGSTTQNLEDKIDSRIETLRELVEKKYSEAFDLRDESEYDGDNEMDDEWKKSCTLMSTANRQLDRIHELCKLTDNKEWGNHEMENEELNGGP